MDISTIASLLGTIKVATEIAKTIKDCGLTLEQAEIKLKLADLISALADVKLEAAEIQEELLVAKRQIQILEDAAKRKASIRWMQPCYWLTGQNDMEREEPYCQPCYDNHGKLARLHDDNIGGYTCMVCKTFFRTEQRLERDRAATKQQLQIHRRSRL